MPGWIDAARQEPIAHEVDHFLRIGFGAGRGKAIGRGAAGCVAQRVFGDHAAKYIAGADEEYFFHR